MLLSLCNVCNFITLIPPGNIQTDAGRSTLRKINESKPLTHYMICESNRLRIKPDSIKVEGESISFTLLEQVNEFDWHDHWIQIPVSLYGHRFSVKTDGPIVSLVFENGPIEQFHNTFLLLQFLTQHLGPARELNELLRLTVKYIGQTEITEKYIRFDGHEKVSSVSSDIIHSRPHREVWVKLLSFQPPFVTMLSTPEIDSPYRRDWLPGGGLLEELPEKSWKTAVEGALIKYFSPEFNVHYKENFPSERHTSYQYLYDKSIRSIVVELHEEYMAFVTGSDTRPYTKIKFIEYALSANDTGPYLHNNDVQDLDEAAWRSTDEG
ncbi:hypothetical protein [Burkholderia ubonensis]|uniref:hypothetical protein n=1 Tax=Burkholderia ubonensis TaxID=101571 RepID=UPI000758CA14|nr:hypothetical protein [Burkholderia ubonensis]KVZ44402.1 hypothetical protein WL17_04925 [Burkholderia ubonensis]